MNPSTSDLTTCLRTENSSLESNTSVQRSSIRTCAPLAIIATLFLALSAAPTWARPQVAVPSHGLGDGTPFEEPEYSPTDPSNEGDQGDDSDGGKHEDPDDPPIDQEDSIQQPGHGPGSMMWRRFEAELFRVLFWVRR